MTSFSIGSISPAFSAHTSSAVLYSDWPQIAPMSDAVTSWRRHSSHVALSVIGLVSILMFNSPASGQRDFFRVMSYSAVACRAGMLPFEFLAGGIIRHGPCRLPSMQVFRVHPQRDPRYDRLVSSRPFHLGHCIPSVYGAGRLRITFVGRREKSAPRSRTA